MNSQTEARRQERAVRITPEFSLEAKHRQAISAIVKRLNAERRWSNGSPSGLFPAYASIKNLYDSVVLGPDEVQEFTQANCGSVILDLYNWGFFAKIHTSAPKASLTPKGWAYAAIFELIADDDLNKVYTSRLSVQLTLRIYEELRRLKKSKDEDPPGLPVIDLNSELEVIVKKRAQDSTQVELARKSVTAHYSKSFMVPRLSEKQIEEAVALCFSSEDIIRADLELVDGPKTAPLYRRELMFRMSAQGMFKPDTLAGIKGVGNDHGHPELKGVGKIEEALNMQNLEAAGRGQGLPGETTLGDVHDRLVRESVQEMDDLTLQHTDGTTEALRPVVRDRGAHTPVGDLSFTVPPSLEADPHDGLIMSEWIDAKVQEMLDGWTKDQGTVGYAFVRKQAALIARRATLKGYREGREQGIAVGKAESDAERPIYPVGSVVHQVGDIMEAKIGYGISSYPMIFLTAFGGGLVALLGFLLFLIFVPGPK